ncbi:hypothetical protein KY358_04295 [Candidatus Woesearchaeota archaeon]|nr:hypothetical protein [Candidatus Woesearchaeota archaeon]
MIFIVADTSALISLSITGIFGFAQDIEFKIAKEAYNELNLIKNYRDKDGYNASRVLRSLKEWSIEVLNIQNKQKLNELLKDPLIDKGEAESLILALERKIEDLITDDLKSIKALNKHSQGRVYISSSVVIPSLLYKSGRISRKQAKEAIIQIGKYRKWDEVLFRDSLDILG